MSNFDEISPSTGRQLIPLGMNQEGCCCANSVQTESSSQPVGWNRRYWSIMVFVVVIWVIVYVFIESASKLITYRILGFSSLSQIGEAVEFFIYDTVKILLLLVGLIYAIAWLRASMNIERVRSYLASKRKIFGYFLGALFGAITPFCSCSSIPLFLGFSTARIPFGITMAFLITSPLINEIAVVLLWGLLGWKFTIIYVLAGMAAGMIGGLLMDTMDAGRWLQPFILESARRKPLEIIASTKKFKLTIWQRHNFAWNETQSIFRRVWLWVIIGVAIGATLHGFVPAGWFARYFGAGEWWTVPTAVFIAIPLYSNVTGIVPIMESLLTKGLPVGTTLAFCMSAVAASIPEVLLLRQIMTFRLQAIFIAYLWIIFTLIGWLFNIFGPTLA